MENPIGLNGIEFLEYTGPEGAPLAAVFEKFGFQKIAHHKKIKMDLYRQGDIHFLLNLQPGTFAEKFHKAHGPSICSMGVRVQDSQKSFQEAIRRGARAYEEKPYPAIHGIGDSLIYFIDDYVSQNFYNQNFEFTGPKEVKGKGYLRIDHLTNNVPKGEMQKWCDFYQNIFGFYQARFFDIKGKKTGLYSKVMKSPCGKIIIPINEPTEGKSQIQEYLEEYHGSGIQHVALLTADIVTSVGDVKKAGIGFLGDLPKSYYDVVTERIPNIQEKIDRLRELEILIDGDDKGYLLQIFTKNIIGPIFFEVIQRRNHDGFGEGNFQALFDSIERDQMARGYLK